MNIDPNTKARIIAQFSKLKTIKYILHVISIGGLFLALSSYRYDNTLTGLSRDTELSIFLGIGVLALVISVIYWRCPNCHKLFWWRLDPKSCRNCGVDLVKPLAKVDENEKNDYRYYIKLRKADTRKFFLFFFIIIAFNAGLAYLIPTGISSGVFYLIFLLTFGIPLFFIIYRFQRCPKCGHHYGRAVPQKCSHCETQLKDYNWSDYR